MISSEFEEIFDQVWNTSEEILKHKANEYANDNNRLHNFNVAAQMQGNTPRRALAGMMAKHTVSVYDLCRDGELAEDEVWDEKIIDHINYLILLRAVVADERSQLSSADTNNNITPKPDPWFDPDIHCATHLNQIQKKENT